MRRIESKFKQLKKTKKKAFIVFMTAGDPNLVMNEALIPEMEKSGVDIIELGIPFSDPVADGPVIQASSLRSLKRGTTLKKTLDLVARVRKHTQIPIVFMTYLNPIWRYGFEKFMADAKKCGVDGLIVPELPPDEEEAFAKHMHQAGLDLIYLLAPTSSDKRIRLVSQRSKGFIYYVSVAGVTGAQKSLPSTIGSQVKRVKRQTKLPICIGFGISNPEQASAMAKLGDGIIVGSAVVKALNEHKSISAQKFCDDFIRPLAEAVAKVR